MTGTHCSSATPSIPALQDDEQATKMAFESHNHGKRSRAPPSTSITPRSTHNGFFPDGPIVWVWCLRAKELGGWEHNHLLLKGPSVRFEYKVILLVTPNTHPLVFMFSCVSGSGSFETLDFFLFTVVPGALLAWVFFLALWELEPVGNNEDIYLCMSSFFKKKKSLFLILFHTFCHRNPYISHTLPRGFYKVKVQAISHCGRASSRGRWQLRSP